jgi:hypothetical protein
MEDHYELTVREQSSTESKTQTAHHYLKKYSIKIDKHTIVDEKKPFVLFALEIQSEYSKFIVLKQYCNFVKLH